jgi:hypothetical protein
MFLVLDPSGCCRWHTLPLVASGKQTEKEWGSASRHGLIVPIRQKHHVCPNLTTYLRAIPL